MDAIQSRSMENPSEMNTRKRCIGNEIPGIDLTYWEDEEIQLLQSLTFVEKLGWEIYLTLMIVVFKYDKINGDILACLLGCVKSLFQNIIYFFKYNKFYVVSHIKKRTLP